MTKTLTEQWREGTLPRGAYYVNRLNEIRIYLVTYEDDKNTHEIYEVLASVPTYAEFNDLMSNLEYIDKYRELVSKTDELKKKLEIALETLGQIAMFSKDNVDAVQSAKAICDIKELDK